MQDGIIKSTGNSRYLKSVANFMSLYPTYEDFAAALIAGTLPIDLNGINPNGWSQQGTALNKAALLKDATAALCGLGSAAVPDDMLKALYNKATAVQTIAEGRLRAVSGSYTGAGTYGEANANTLTFPFRPVLCLIFVPDGAGSILSFFLVYMMSAQYANERTLYLAGLSDNVTKSPNIYSKISGNTLSWYNTLGNVPQNLQLNRAGFTYSYLAIG